MTPRLAKLVADVFTGAVIVSVAIAFAGLTWRLVAGQVPMISVPAPGPAVRPPVDLAPVLALAPFGRAGAADAPPTSLGIELRGIMLANPKNASTALIAPTNGTPQPVTIGDAIGGSTVEAIEIDRVLLRVGDRLETLAFPKLTPTPAPAPAAAAVSQPANPLPVKAGEDAADLIGNLGATPTGNGYRIGDTMAPAMRQAGLQPGDIIERINGTPLGNAEQDRQLLSAAALSGSVRADIVRDGRRITLSFPLR